MRLYLLTPRNGGNKAANTRQRHHLLAGAVCAMALGFATPLHAENSAVLRFDTPLAITDNADFDRDNPLEPDSSSFILLDASSLSSDSGERWALVSLRNDAGGQRILRDDYLVAEFANGDRRHASDLEGSFAAAEQQRKMVFFGYHRFPILRVFTQQ
ncbi:hypothetical protein A3754_16710 [Alcanivorax sp. HI0083]|uniref:hypothetical protein n=1 Tax=Alcanivorax sp. HI0083 TaxID=1822258 RepID=UPI0007B8ACBA|nr:hypothetical protein [Alcanivorax sp. HI0083]KZZ24431.1 hypothetical protein A3754_16710 [Alcanivorax sp. HI0083]